MLAHALEMDRLDLYLQHDRPVSESELVTYRRLIRRRAHREPLQYVLGRTAFRELELSIDSRVLIPRPETEELVSEVLDWVRRRAPHHGPLRALDLGTGSGAIALSLLREGRFAKVVATDTSQSALELAATNAGRLGLSEEVDFRLGRYFRPVQASEQFHVIVSNPPYIPSPDLRALEPEVREWEPWEALDGGPDGLSHMRTIVRGAGKYLLPGGLLALEVGFGQATLVSELVRDCRAFRSNRIRRDLGGRERLVLAELAGTETRRSQAALTPSPAHLNSPVERGF